MIKLYICCLVLIIGSVEVGLDIDMNFHQEVMEIVSYDTFKEEIKSLVELCILEEVTEHTDWVNSYVIVEKDSGNHHAPNHTIKRKLRICLDPRDLN